MAIEQAECQSGLRPITRIADWRGSLTPEWPVVHAANSNLDESIEECDSGLYLFEHPDPEYVSRPLYFAI